MKKISPIVLPVLTILLEALPLGAVCIFAPSPTERITETFSYFSLNTIWLCKFCSAYYGHTYYYHLVAFVDFTEEK